MNRPRLPAFVWLLFAGVYGGFLWSFGHKVADYVRDVWRHFDFVRDWLS